MSNAPRRPAWQLPVVTLVALVVLSLVGQSLANADTYVSCGPLLAQCRITVNNNSFWPQRIDTGSIMVDGNPAQSTGGGIAWPFGSTTVLLFGQDGGGLTTLKTVALKIGPLLEQSTEESMTTR